MWEEEGVEDSSRERPSWKERAAALEEQSGIGRVGSSQSQDTKGTVRRGTNMRRRK